MDDHIIYRLDENISFRKCSLYDDRRVNRGDCTNFGEREINFLNYYECRQHGIHLHCTTHPAIELEEVKRDTFSVTLKCPRCNKPIKVDSVQSVINSCLKLLNIELFKDATLVRLDDWYVPEIKAKAKTPSGYWAKADVKTDKDGDTMIVVYVGHEGSEGKAQFFVKPEKLQLTSDHKDMDPAKVLTKIEVTLKDRTLSQEYN